MDYFFTAHPSPSAFLEATRSSLRQHQRKLNVILPHAEKLAAQERSGQPFKEGQFWITGWSYSPSQSQSPSLDIVLSCTEHNLGTYPIFLVVLRDLPSIPDTSLDPQMRELARFLASKTDLSRVFSIYGQERPTLFLSRYWSDLTGARLISEPYYAASSSYCTRATLMKRDHSVPSGHEMRLARQTDLEAVARLCQEFADDSVRIQFGREPRPRISAPFSPLPAVYFLLPEIPSSLVYTASFHAYAHTCPSRSPVLDITRPRLCIHHR
jgi:hypothetical protein